jgi:UDP-N-acetylmuramate: L-alanyl-gamma-D-glutamyl-meso-diaminopimelate ligase
MGIAGTAMAALAGMLQDAGFAVTGSDQKVYPPMSDYLAGLHIRVSEGYKASNLDHRPDLVVVGNVVRAVYEEAVALTTGDLPYMSFPEVLGHLFLTDAHSVVIAGTHGKTTTTALSAWLLEAAGRNPGFLVGGVARNFDRTARRGGGEVFVIEGDEYDTAFFDKGPKFLHYRPKTVLLTSIEFDHADIYRDLAHVQESFRKLLRLIPASGLLIARGDDPNVAAILGEAQCSVETYGPGQQWDGRIDSVDTTTGKMAFTVLRRGEPVLSASSALVGTHNLYNQVAATAMAMSRGVVASELQRGFDSFEGIKRRQEVIGEPGGVTVIDDFAHHPTAVRVTIEALRQRFGKRRLWVIWEPRSATSRRAVFQDAYAESFDGADQVIIARPFDAGSLPADDRLDADRLVADIGRRGVDALALHSADEIAQTVGVRAHPMDVVAIFSNGGFDGLHGKLLRTLGLRFGPPA